MDELISRQAAIDACLDGWNKGYEEILADIRALPSAERRGRWKGAGMGDYMCSRCAKVVSGNRYHYCPNCGAKMEVEE